MNSVKTDSLLEKILILDKKIRVQGFVGSLGVTSFCVQRYFEAWICAAYGVTCDRI